MLVCSHTFAPHALAPSDTGANYDPAPDLDHTNPQLRAALVDWLTWMRTDLGFGGWRFDFAKGYGAEFIKQYVEESGMDKVIWECGAREHECSRNCGYAACEPKGGVSTATR